LPKPALASNQISAIAEKPLTCGLKGKNCGLRWGAEHDFPYFWQEDALQWNVTCMAAMWFAGKQMDRCSMNEENAWRKAIGRLNSRVLVQSDYRLPRWRLL
jgi:hypothetical protein